MSAVNTLGVWERHILRQDRIIGNDFLGVNFVDGL